MSLSAEANIPSPTIANLDESLERRDVVDADANTNERAHEVAIQVSASHAESPSESASGPPIMDAEERYYVRRVVISWVCHFSYLGLFLLTLFLVTKAYRQDNATAKMFFAPCLTMLVIALLEVFPKLFVKMSIRPNGRCWHVQEFMHRKVQEAVLIVAGFMLMWSSFYSFNSELTNAIVINLWVTLTVFKHIKGTKSYIARYNFSVDIPVLSSEIQQAVRQPELV